jgi:hypothetical protein
MGAPCDSSGLDDPQLRDRSGHLPGDLLHSSGEWSARLIILALMLTPLSILVRGRAWVQWLVRRRRAFGVAGFGYALLHLLFYLLDMETVGMSWRNWARSASGPDGSPCWSCCRWR